MAKEESHRSGGGPASGREIERKWLVARVPAGLPPGRSLRQGYLSDGGDGEVRVRQDGDRHLLTAKRGRGLVREEVELSLPIDDFAALWALTRGRRVEKTRHVLAWGAVQIEVDVFAGALAGLVVAEVEFPSAAAARAWTGPDWLGPELTGRPGWSNGDLARHGRPLAP